MSVDANDAIEGFRAQRNEHADKEVHWFSMYMAEKRKNEALTKEIEELKKPKEAAE